MHRAEVAAAAAKARRDTERRLLGSKSPSAMGNRERPKPAAQTAPVEAAAPPRVTQDSGSTPE
jgi:hypothetical protein